MSGNHIISSANHSYCSGVAFQIRHEKYGLIWYLNHRIDYVTFSIFHFFNPFECSFDVPRYIMQLLRVLCSVDMPRYLRKLTIYSIWMAESKFPRRTKKWLWRKQKHVNSWPNSCPDCKLWWTRRDFFIHNTSLTKTKRNGVHHSYHFHEWNYMNKNVTSGPS